jgi:hypothetical protein
VDLIGYDAYVSGMSNSPYVQGPDVAAGAVPVSSGVSPSQPAGPTAMATSTSGKAGPLMHNGLMGQPVHWWFLLAAFYVGLQWLAKRYNVPRFTIVQLVIITLNYIVVIVALKFIVSWKTIPGLTPVVLTA